MRKCILIPFIFILMLTLVCCKSKGKDYEMKDYVLKLDYKEDFKILQLTDTHIANKDNRQLQYDFMDLTISESDADLIVITGDLFTFADKVVAKEFFAFIDSYGIPWTVVFGNHDEQCYFSVEWMTRLLNNYGSNCYFLDLQDDNVFGNCNFVINLMDGNNIKEQLIFIDSNRYIYGTYIGYDYIKEDQVKWYEEMVNYTKELNGGVVVPSLAFFHIPLPEVDDAWNAYEKGEAILEEGVKNEPSCPPKYNSGLFDKMLELASTKAMFFGHDHLNSFRILYKGIYFCYGVDSTDRIYYDESLLGGQVVTIKNDNSLSFRQIFHHYSEVK